MKTPDTAIAFDRVAKHFRCFASPLDRVKEALHPTGKVYHTAAPVLRDVNFVIPRGQRGEGCAQRDLSVAHVRRSCILIGGAHVRERAGCAQRVCRTRRVHVSHRHREITAQLAVT